jgi:hypothetical protein
MADASESGQCGPVKTVDSAAGLFTMPSEPAA